MLKTMWNVLSRFIFWQFRGIAKKQILTCQSILVFLLIFSSGSALFAQSSSNSEEPILIKSMGLPRIWKPNFGSMIAWDRTGHSAGIDVELNLGIYKDLMSPVTSAFGVASEGYVNFGSGDVDGGLRVLGGSNILFTHVGVDYSFGKKELDFITSFRIPLRRGGPLGKGGSLRFDWLPKRNHYLGLGLSIPIGQPHMGKTRPKSDHVSLPSASAPRKSDYHPEAKLSKSLMSLRHSIDWINQFTTPFFDQSVKKSESDLEPFIKSIQELRSHINLKDSIFHNGHTFEEEVRAYHREFQKTFSLALRVISKNDSITASRIADKAKEILLDEVILPYNRLLGQQKEHDSVLGFGLLAENKFGTWIKTLQNVPADKYAALDYVFHSILMYIEEIRSNSRTIWEDSRLVWIPLHYALRFEDHDTEDELDAIIERAVGHEFTDANDVHYVVNELFQPELVRMILAAKDYHVLWTHDFRGKNESGNPDEVSYKCVVDGYLEALIEGVKEYEKTRKIPVFMIFLDQNYFERNKSRLWLDLLENPLGHEVHLPDNFKEWEQVINKYQDDLRAAIAQSQALQADIRRYGKKWLNNKIKVHVSVTNPSDLSFRSSIVFKYLRIIPDNIMRDHRKITFYDVTELDPALGEAMYTGLGVGEHYVGATWDDRSILIRGPALVSLKDAARELLLSQGFKENDIPAPLLRMTKPDNYEELLDVLRAKGWTATAMQLQNVTGFGMKYANIIKAIIYTLMPKGSHLYIPDSLWISPFWGSMLIGASLRGCVVLVIAPALENAPSAGKPQMSRANELFTRFLIIQKQLDKEITSAGGLFKTGIYNMDYAVDDIVSKIQRINDVLAQNEIFRTIFPFSASVEEMLASMPETLLAKGIEPKVYSKEDLANKPKLHLKSQFFATAETINTLIPLEEWKELITKYIFARGKQIDHRESNVEAKDLRKVLVNDVAMLLHSWSKDLPKIVRERAILYLLIGSHNQDYRSMIMDGEALCVVGRAWAMVAYLDFVSLIGQTTWVQNLDELERLLPNQEGFSKWLGKYMEIAL